MFGGSGVIAGKKDTIIVDAQNRSDQADLILELMQLYELKLSNVRHIILTHADSDHIGGLSQLKRVTGAKIIANSEEAKRIENSTQSEGFTTARAGPWEPCKVDVKVERDGRVRKVEEKTSVTSGRWMIS